MTTALTQLDSRDKADECIIHALKVRSAWTNANFVKFFKLYAAAPKMSGYLIDWFVERERKRALKIMIKSYVYSCHVFWSSPYRPNYWTITAFSRTLYLVTTCVKLMRTVLQKYCLWTTESSYASISCFSNFSMAFSLSISCFVYKFLLIFHFIVISNQFTSYVCTFLLLNAS